MEQAPWNHHGTAGSDQSIFPAVCCGIKIHLSLNLSFPGQETDSLRSDVNCSQLGREQTKPSEWRRAGQCAQGWVGKICHQLRFPTPTAPVTGFRVPAPHISSAPRVSHSVVARCPAAAAPPSLLAPLQGQRKATQGPLKPKTSSKNLESFASLVTLESCPFPFYCSIQKCSTGRPSPSLLTLFTPHPH